MIGQPAPLLLADALPVLEGIAAAATLAAAAIAGFAAWTARQSFVSQTATAAKQLELADRQLHLVNDQAAQQRETDQTMRGHASMTLLLRFRDQWDGETMRRFRSRLAQATLAVHDSPTASLDPEAQVALDEIGNFVELVGYCTTRGLLFEDDAWQEFSDVWEVYWQEYGERLRPPAGDTTIFENANWLLGRFRARAPEPHTPVSPAELADFWVTEKNRARVEEGLLGQSPGRLGDAGAEALQAMSRGIVSS